MIRIVVENNRKGVKQSERWNVLKATNGEVKRNGEVKTNGKVKRLFLYTSSVYGGPDWASHSRRIIITYYPSPVAFSTKQRDQRFTGQHNNVISRKFRLRIIQPQQFCLTGCSCWKQSLQFPNLLEKRATFLCARFPSGPTASWTGKAHQADIWRRRYTSPTSPWHKGILSTEDCTRGCVSK